MSRKTRSAPSDPYPMTIETFGDPSYYIGQIRGFEPSCFNGVVSVVRYRVTVERIEEPAEVIEARMRKLWRELPYNHHHSFPLRREAIKYGVTLDDKERAVDAPKARP